MFITDFQDLNFRLASAGLFSGPNVDSPQNTFQSDKQMRYDGSWTKGTHLIRYGYSLNRILGGGFAELFWACSARDSSQPALSWQIAVMARPAPCPSDPLNGYFASSSRVWEMAKGFFTEKPGFNLPGGGTRGLASGRLHLRQLEGHAELYADGRTSLEC